MIYSLKKANKKYTRKFKNLIITLLAIFTLSCATNDKISRQENFSFIPENNNLTWEKLSNENIEYFSYKDKNITYYILKINLNDENIKITAYPNNENQTKSLRSKKFEKITHSKIAINTSPYKKIDEKKFKENKDIIESKIMGVHIANGKKYSSELKRYSAVSFEKDENQKYTAKIISSQNKDALKNSQFAFGGFFTILENGEIQQFNHISYEARSAIGIADNGRTIYLLAVEKSWKSSGLSYPECAEIFKTIGVTDAMEFDGGHSTSFYIEEKNLRLEQSIRNNAAYLGFDY